jgi:hypothetical protein
MTEEFITVMVDDQKVRTSWSTVNHLGDKFPKLVREFLDKNLTVYSYGSNMMVDDAEEKTVDGVQMVIMSFEKDGVPIVLIDSKKRLVEVGVIKRGFVRDGQNKLPR